MELGLDLKQTQTLSPQMIQTMKIMQMGAQELLEYISQTIQENPVLESEAPQPSEPVDTLRRKLDWLASTDVQNRWYHQQDVDEGRDLLDLVCSDPLEENLYYYLKSQVRFERLPKPTAQALDYLMESLNPNGWLDEPMDDLCSHLALPPDTIQEAVTILQSLEPAGVGARNLRECLRLQLIRRGETGLPLTIVDHYLEAMSQDHYHFISKETGEGRTAVQSACSLIRTLNPRPASGFSEREHLQYITPDLVVVNFETHFEILTNDSYLPSLNLSPYYNQLYKETNDPQVKEYLNEKLHQAQWLLRSIDQRRSTLMSCAQCIVDHQEDFFRRGPGHLRPMVLADVATKLDVNDSTVSRAIRDKYVQCAHGLFPLGYFFTRGIGNSSGGEGVSSEQIKTQLHALIDREDKQKPLSDQKLCQLLEEQGVTISRRTIAKYRDELGIPSTAGRKIFK